jgi:hypothetical protein
MDELREKCFFCSETIEGKKSKEHIIPNSLLGKLGIKETVITGERKTQYSRVKVPAHGKCNSEFGSRYEDRVLELLEDTDSLYESLKEEETSSPMMYMPDESPTSIITTWLSKIYYGLFYYDYLTTKDEDWKVACARIFDHQNFEYVRSSYENGHGFQLPSSLYVFKTTNTETDLVTMIDPSSILFKINSLTLILCICDGYLTKNYLNEDILERLRERVTQEDEHNIDFPSHKYAFGEILALRSCIPKKPKFISGENQIINMSLSTLVANPEEHYRIDPDLLKSAREEILLSFNIDINKCA